MRSQVGRFDAFFIDAVMRLPHWIRPLMVFLSIIGQPVFMGIILGVLAVVAWSKANTPLFWAAFTSAWALLISTALKQILHRTRPDTYVPGYLRSYSFPSGHAYGTLLCFGLLAYLAIKYLAAPWGFVIAAVLGLIVLLTGLSRIYLGAHYPTDVLGGWVLGAVVLLVIIKTFHI
jgi:membrane-associated phospholipid phosphatase